MTDSQPLTKADLLGLNESLEAIRSDMKNYNKALEFKIDANGEKVDDLRSDINKGFETVHEDVLALGKTARNHDGRIVKLERKAA